MSSSKRRYGGRKLAVDGAHSFCRSNEADACCLPEIKNGLTPYSSPPSRAHTKQILLYLQLSPTTDAGFVNLKTMGSVRSSVKFEEGRDSAKRKSSPAQSSLPLSSFRNVSELPKSERLYFRSETMGRRQVEMSLLLHASPRSTPSTSAKSHMKSEKNTRRYSLDSAKRDSPVISTATYSFFPVRSLHLQCWTYQWCLQVAMKRKTWYYCDLR